MRRRLHSMHLPSQSKYPHQLKRGNFLPLCPPPRPDTRNVIWLRCRFSSRVRWTYAGCLDPFFSISLYVPPPNPRSTAPPYMPRYPLQSPQHESIPGQRCDSTLVQPSKLENQALPGDDCCRVDVGMYSDREFWEVSSQRLAVSSGVAEPLVGAPYVMRWGADAGCFDEGGVVEWWMRCWVCPRRLACPIVPRLQSILLPHSLP